MRSEARLDSAVFQLTPTRTRCDLVIIANGKTEKLASGLLNPFLAHLKAAQDQIAKGGYSITLEPDPSIDAFWFTKGTIERFVRFVSTPEVLERVTTIESEILQIEEALTIQSNENLGLSTVEDHQTRSAEYIEGSKPVFDADAEKAIVLYKPGSLPLDSNGSTAQEENSKVQLLRVLETRKIVLQKEQGMAFARATAAGFDMDHMTHLITFADAFGASRMKDACLRFMELWRVKHETGQWFEVEAAEAMSMRSGFSPFNASGIVLAGDMRSAGGDLSIESNGNDVTADHGNDKDKRFPSDPQVFHGQSQQPAYPPWAMHPPPGAFQPYPMPYYQNYPANGPFYPPPYPPAEDPRFNAHQRSGMRRHSMNSKDNDIDSELEDAIDQSLSDFERESSHGRKSHRGVGRSGKKKNGVVVIKNLNYIASKKHGVSDGELQSASDTETEGESESSRSDAAERKHKKSSRSLKKHGDHKRSSETSNGYDMDAMVKGNDADSGNWQAFQSFLLRAEEKTTSTADGDMFAGEKEPASKKRQNVGEAEPIFTPERESGDNHEARLMEFDSISGKTSRTRQVASNDEMLASSERSLGGSHSDAQFVEVVGGGGGYRRTTTDDFMIYGQETQINSKKFSDPLAEAAEHEYKWSGDLEKSSFVLTDESFLVPFRSGSQDQFETDNRTAIDMDLDFPSSNLRKEDNESNVKAQVIYEPDDLAMMPERAIESDYGGYDPAIDYEMQIPFEVAVNQETVEQEEVPASTEELKTSDKEKKLKGPKDGLEKRKKDAMMRRGPPSKSVPLTEAQKRAEKLRAYKVDLQREKKANEEEARKRLEALKLERQKRIAARSGSTTAQSPTAAKQTRPGFPAKVSPSSFKGSKSTDPDSGSNSSPRKMPKKSSSIGNNDSKITKTATFNGSMNGLTKSASSLTELKKDSNGAMPEVNAAAARRRLSDPNVRNVQNATKKPESTDQIPKRNITNAPQMKVSAITQLDKSRSATLPELKVKAPRGPSETAQNKLVTKEKLQKQSGSSSNQGSGSFPNEKTPSISNSDENPVIEKTVVMLENEMVTGSIRADDSKKDDADEKIEPDSEYAAIRAPPSPVIKDEVEVPNQRKPVDQMDYYEVVDNSPKTEPRNVSNYVTKNLYQAPHARASSMEDAAASSLEYTGAQAVHESETTSVHGESIKAHVASFSPDSNLADQDHESFEKPRSKESKGFRKLLKFGRKTHSSASGEGAIDSDGSVVDDQTESGSSNDVHYLKNLISQDDAHAGGTPTKVHRPFSILSPFRSSKSSEKKLAA